MKEVPTAQGHNRRLVQRVDKANGAKLLVLRATGATPTPQARRARGFIAQAATRMLARGTHLLAAAQLQRQALGPHAQPHQPGCDGSRFLFFVVSRVPLLVICGGSTGGDGEYDDGAGGGGSGGCLSLDGASLEVASTAVISVSGGDGGTGGYCGASVCGANYCGGGGGGGGGGAAFFGCESCSVDGVATDADGFLGSVDALVYRAGGVPGLGGTGSEGACATPAADGLPGGDGLSDGM